MQNSVKIESAYTGIRVNLRKQWLSILLLFIPLEIAILSVEQAHWLQEQPSLTLVLILSVITAFYLNTKNVHTILKWFLLVLIGLVITGWQIFMLLPPSAAPWFEQLFNAFKTAWNVVLMSGTEETTIHFSLFLLLFTWFLGIYSTWLLLKKNNVWIPVLLGLAVILLNLSNLPENYYGFLFFYLLTAATLIGYVKTTPVTVSHRKADRVSGFKGKRYLVVSLIIISLIASSGAWLMQGVFPKLGNEIESGGIPIVRNIENYLNNFLSKVPRKQPIIRASSQGEFSFELPYERYGDTIHFIINTDSPYYWRTWVYDVYTSSGWENSSSTAYVTNSGETYSTDQTSGRKPITFEVETNLETDLILTTGEFLTVDREVIRNIFDSPYVNQNQAASDLTKSITSASSIRSGIRYTVSSAVTSATADQLNQAGTEYPDWITDRFLQLPEGLPESVLWASANFTANATTPYEKAIAITEALSEYVYNRRSGSLPEGMDEVDYFLFDKRSGSCGDFSTATAVLLRVAGVPTRLCTGYLIGERETNSNSYLVRVSDRHAWAEVYFPGYGWIEFESTPGGDTTRGVVGVEAVLDNGETETWDPQVHMEPFLYPQLYPTDFGSSGSQSYSPDTSTNSDNSIPILVWPLLILGGGIAAAFISYIIYFLRTRTGTKRTDTEMDYETEAYTGMCELASQIGLGPKPYQTPLEYSGELTAEFPGQAHYINMIRDAFLTRKYSNSVTEDEKLRWDLIKARRSVFDAIRDVISGRR